MTDDEIKAAIAEAIAANTAELAAKHEADIKGLKSKNTELITANKALKDAADELEESKAEAAGDIEAIKASHTKALAKIEAERDEAFQARNTLMIDNVIAADLAKHNVSPAFRSVLAQAWKTQASVQDGAAQIDGQPIADFISNFVSSGDGKHYVTAPQTTGGGATGSSNSEASEFTKETFNLTEFSKLSKTDPAKANEVSESLGLSYRV